MPVLRGPNRGFRWRVGAGPHSCWLGLYEQDELSTFSDLIRPGNTVFDIGANAGYFTLAAARAAGRSGSVVAFEPLQKPADWLGHHVDINGIRNVTVERVAVSDAEGIVHFEPRAGGAQGELVESGSITVPTTTVDRVCDRLGRHPDVMKVDVEGAEGLVLRGAQRTLADGRPTILLETHSEPLWKECIALLESHDYRFEPIAPWTGHQVISGTFLAIPR